MAKGLATALEQIGSPAEARHPDDRPLGAVLRETAVHHLALADIDVGPNVRKDVGDLEGLAQSIREQGVLQPVKVSRAPGGRYVLLWGQRRFLAAQLAELETIPAFVEAWRPDATSLQLEQLVENLQRADMAPLEEAAALEAVLEAWPNLTHEALGTKLGRSRAWVSNTLRLLEVPAPVRTALEANRVSGTAARAAIGLSDDDAKHWLAAAERGANARQLEEEAKRLKGTTDQRAARQAEEDGRWRLRAQELRDLGATPTSRVFTGYSKDGCRVLTEEGFATVVDERPEHFVTLFSSEAEACCDAYEVSSWRAPYRACVDVEHQRERKEANERSWTQRELERKAQNELRKAEHEALAGRVGRWLGTLRGDDLARALAIREALAAGVLHALVEELSIEVSEDQAADHAALVALVWADPLFNGAFAREWLAGADADSLAALAVLAS